MIISIHQPNFIPWYPFFQKIQAVDKFIILSHCQFEKNGYTNRFMLGDRWHTMSVKKGLIPIREKYYADPHTDWRKIKNKLPAYGNILNELDDCIFESLEKTNVLIINKIMSMLDINTEIVMDHPTTLRSTHRLIDICQRHGATEYLSGAGGKNYLDTKLFQDSKIKLSFQGGIERKHVLEVL